MTFTPKLRLITVAGIGALALAGCSTMASGDAAASSDGAQASASAGANPMVGGAEMFPTKTIAENASASADHTTLVAAVKAAGLVDTLKGAGPFTVFAPTDDAFAKLPAGTVEGLLKPENLETLKNILLYHVVPGTVMAADVVTLDGKSADTAFAGKSIAISVKDGKVYLNKNVQVIITDIETTNGVIHVIDTVLLPE